jgi:hypothetical protein
MATMKDTMRVGALKIKRTNHLLTGSLARTLLIMNVMMELQA